MKVVRQWCRDPVNFQTGIGWANMLHCLGSGRFIQNRAILRISPEVAIQTDDCIGSFVLDGALGDGQIMIQFVDFARTENSRVQSFRHVASGASISFAGNDADGVSDTATRGIGISFSGSAVDAILKHLSPPVRAFAAERIASKPSLAVADTPVSIALKQRLTGIARHHVMRDPIDPSIWRNDLAEEQVDLAVPEGRLEFQEAAFIEMAANMIEEAVGLPRSSPGTMPGQRVRLARQVTHMLAASPGERHAELSLPEIAARLNVSRRLVQMAVQEAYGMGFVAYRRILRLHQFRRALLANRGRASVTEVAHEFLFQNPGRMARDYRNFFGRTPSADLRAYLRAND